MLPSLISATGKYRFLVVSIALFIIFDLGVLALNFYTSGKIAEQTARINLAGQQRTLTQQMSKATLYIESQKLKLWVYQSGLEELRNYYTLFGSTLELLDQGGSTVSADTGEIVTIEKVLDDEARETLDESIILWRDFQTVMAPLLVDVLITDEEIIPASEFIAAKNLQMLSLMDQLTDRFTKLSERQTNFLRMAQVIGIALATFNFFVILFHFIRQLRQRDEKLEIKQHESDQILDTIAEGVFLVDENLRIGGQHSRFLQEIFQVEKMAGRKFDRFLSRYVSKKTVKTTIEYLQLYYKKHINPELIADVNPLKGIKALVPSQDDEVVEKYLDFSFALIRNNSGQDSVLVTVNDVTASVRLEQESNKSKADSEVQVAILSQLINLDRSELGNFFSELEVGYARLNQLLKNNKNVSDNYHDTLIKLLREAHKLKGSASVIDLPWVVDSLHEFESQVDEVQQLADKTKITGKALLPLTIKLNSMYEKLDQIRGFINHFDLPTTKAVENRPQLYSAYPENKQWAELKKLALKLAKQRDLFVDVQFRGLSEVLDRNLSDRLLKICTQLVRNSIAHGFESKKIRSGLKKPNTGQVSISLSHDNKHNYRLVYEDDGRGFDYRAIEKTLKDKGVYQQKHGGRLTKTELIKHSFSDSFSSSDKVDVLAGRGIGLGLILSQVRELNGKIKVRSMANEFTKFIIDFRFDVLDQTHFVELPSSKQLA